VLRRERPISWQRPVENDSGDRTDTGGYFGQSRAIRQTNNNQAAVGPMHIAETRDKARADVQHGIDAWLDYFQEVQAAVHFQVAEKRLMNASTSSRNLVWQ
jgi:hypothetical protein